MTSRRIALTALLAVGVVWSTQAADIKEGRSTAMFTCVECHGENGIGNQANRPNLASQKEMYLVSQLRTFKAGNTNLQ